MTTLDHNVGQHTVNVVAISIPAVSFWAHFPGFITGITGTMGLLWYIVLFTKEIRHWFRKRKSHTK